MACAGLGKSLRTAEVSVPSTTYLGELPGCHPDRRWETIPWKNHHCRVSGNIRSDQEAEEEAGVSPAGHIERLPTLNGSLREILRDEVGPVRLHDVPGGIVLLHSLLLYPLPGKRDGK